MKLLNLLWYEIDRNDDFCIDGHDRYGFSLSKALIKNFVLLVISTFEKDFLVLLLKKLFFIPFFFFLTSDFIIIIPQILICSLFRAFSLPSK